jgi:DNA primase large subunit
VAGVEIFRRYAGYPGEVVATTNAEGYYLSDFYPIPGDEMVTVWAEAPELRFAPEYYYWRHYYGYEITGHDFTVRRP